MGTANQSEAERVAGVLRRRITDGAVRPGTRLVEEDLVGSLGVSRNTLREAFRLLTHDGLLVHRLHRGVFVSVLDSFDVLDLYRLRRLLECQTVRSLSGVGAAQLAPLKAEVAASEAAVARGDWAAVGTSNMHFHQHLVALGGSPRIDRVARQVIAELRLVFQAVADPQLLHEPYVARNRTLLTLLEKGSFARAGDELERYLFDSERQLLAAYRSAPPQER